MAKQFTETTAVLKERTGLGKYMKVLSAAVTAYRKSMNQYGEAIIKVKAR